MMMIDLVPDQGATGSARDWAELLVPFDGSLGAEKVLRRACRTARRDDDGLAVLCVVKLPADDEAAWGDSGLDHTAMAALARAQMICREEGVVGVFKLNYARDLAGAIVAEARRSDAALICMSLDEFDEHELSETALMSQTVQAVLASAPCSVLLDNPTIELQPGSAVQSS
jgi:nucleotide-binding universal stress UspA family protein